MFSIFHGLFTLFAIGADNVITSNQNVENKARAKANGNLTYYGAKGNEYLVENDRWVSTKTDLSTGHTVIADMKTSKIYYDLTAQKEKEEVKKIKEQGKTVRLKNKREKEKFIHIANERFISSTPFLYIDLNTNHYLKWISINNIAFYMDFETGYITRITDEEKENKKNNHTEEEINNVILLFNKHQDYIKTIISGDKYYYKLLLFDNIDYLDINEKGELFKKHYKFTEVFDKEWYERRMY